MPRIPFVAVAALLAIATGAAGPPPPLTLGPASAERGGPPPGPLFISPSGEPFRTADGLSVWFAQADADHDGRITPAELREDAGRFFRRLDADGNAVLDGFEAQAYPRDIVPEIGRFGFDDPQARGRGKGQPRRAGEVGAARYGLLNEPEPVANGDSDFSGKITLAEWMALTDRRFARLDKAGAGVLTMEGLAPPADGKTQPRR